MLKEVVAAAHLMRFVCVSGQAWALLLHSLVQSERVSRKQSPNTTHKKTVKHQQWHNARCWNKSNNKLHSKTRLDNEPCLVHLHTSSLLIKNTKDCGMDTTHLKLIMGRSICGTRSSGWKAMHESCPQVLSRIWALAPLRVHIKCYASNCWSVHSQSLCFCTAY